MGSVKHETPAQGYGKHEWDVVNFSSVENIKTLIKFRSQFDEFYTVKNFFTNNICVSNGIPSFCEMITCVYCDLDELISKTKLSTTQNMILNMLMIGYDENYIADSIKCQIDVVKKQITAICRRLFETYKNQYSIWLETSEVIKLKPTDVFKQCSKCGEYKLSNKKYFRVRCDDKGDGFRTECRQCEVVAKNVKKNAK